MSALNKITFSGYKAFQDEQMIELRPITLFVGKNSSGKTSLLRLILMLSDALRGSSSIVLPLKVGDIRIGSDYIDLFHNHQNSGLKLNLEMADGTAINVEYCINGGNVSIVNYSVTQSGKCITLDNNKAKVAVKGLCARDVFSELGIEYGGLIAPVEYIGPVRVQSPSSIEFKGVDGNIGADGSGAYDILFNSYRTTNKKLLSNVSDWMYEYMEGHSLSFTNSANNSGIYSLMVHHNSVDVNISQVGQGVQQLLPIVVDAFNAKQGSLNIIEQPVLHLHPAAHSEVARLLGTQAKQSGSTFVVESHSLNFLLGLRSLVADPRSDFTADDIAVYSVEDADNVNKGSMVRRINILNDGSLDGWPAGVFYESFELTKQILNFRK